MTFAGNSNCKATNTGSCGSTSSPWRREEGQTKIDVLNDMLVSTLEQ